MPAKTFPSDAALVKFANSFACIHLDRFQKDIEVCSTPNQDGRSAYFPALMACIGVLDLFSGLYAGKMDRPNPSLCDLKNYARAFLPTHYSNLLLTILYTCFRHKVAHMAHPYDVFDTATRESDFSGEPRRLITWNLDMTENCPAMILEELPNPEPLTRAPPGWGVVYDHRIYIHIRSFAEDIVCSIVDANGYLGELANDPCLRANFTKCMNDYYWTD